MKCELCPRDILPHEERHAYRLVQGWAKPREAGGTNALALREDLGPRAHASCVRLKADGIAVGQGTLA